jgi:hypothetical protein
VAEGDVIHTAPHDELIEVVRDLMAPFPGGVTLDQLANALRERGFRRTSGSPRLITRLKRIKEIEVTRTGLIRVGNGQEQHAEPERAPARTAAIQQPDDADVDDAEDGVDEGAEDGTDEGAGEGAEGEAVAAEAGAEGGQRRRRRRRGGRRRRGRRGGSGNGSNGEGESGGGEVIAAAPPSTEY